MTKLQAETSIEFLKNIWSDCEFDNGTLRYAVESLEMQIPKKPIDVITSDNEYIRTVCGNCEHIFGINKNYDYCPYCGNRIDWEEVER